jgi:hypothetical protein
MLQPKIWWSHEGFRDAFEEAGILRGFTGILENVDPALAVAKRYRDLPQILIKTFVYNSISRLDDFAKESHGYVGKVMNYFCEELQVLLNGVLEEISIFGGD